MKKRHLRFLITNLVAILAAVASVFLPWWQGLKPSDVALTKLLPFDFLNHFGFSPSVVLVIFVGAAVGLLGALLAVKLVVLLGAAVNTAVLVLWFLTFHIGWQPGQFGDGLYLMAASILVTVLSLFILKKRPEVER